MSTTADQHPATELESAARIRLDRIDVVPGFNARDFDVDNPPLDDPEFAQLVESVKTVGVRVPVQLRSNGDRFLLVAGHRRLAAAKLADQPSVPAVLTEEAEQATNAAVENLVRSDLNPLEQAKAIAALKDEKGLSDDGVAKAIGTSVALVRNRLAILTLPEQAQQLFGAPGLSPRAVDALVTLHQHPGAEQWFQILVESLESNPDNDIWWRVNSTAKKAGAFGTTMYLDNQHGDSVGALATKKAEKTALDELIAARGYKQSWELSQGKLTIGEIFLDQARAAGVLLEAPDGADRYGPWIADKKWLKENLVPIIKAEIEATKAAKKKDKSTKADKAGLTPKQQNAAAELREVRAELRQLKTIADEANQQLWRDLLGGVTLDTDLPFDYARLFVFGQLGADLAQLPIIRLAQVARACVPELRKVETIQPPANSTKRATTTPRTKVVLADQDEAIAWVLKFLDTPKTSGELISRWVVLLALSRHALRHGAPTRKDEWFSLGLYSHKDLAGKALDAIVKAALPKGHKQTAAKIERAKTKLSAAERAKDSADSEAARAARAARDTQVPDVNDEVDLDDAADFDGIDEG